MKKNLNLKIEKEIMDQLLSLIVQNLDMDLLDMMVILLLPIFLLAIN